MTAAPIRIALATAAAVAALPPAAPADAKGLDGAPVIALAADAQGVWAWSNRYELLRLDATTNRIDVRVDTLPALITDLARGAGGVWGSGFCGRPRCAYGILMRFDPRTGRRSRPLTRLGLRPRALTVGHGAVWVLGARRVLRIDPGTRRVEGPAIPIGRNALDIATGFGVVWVTTGPGRGATRSRFCRLVGIEPGTRRVVRRQSIPCGTTALAAGAGAVWASAPAPVGGLVRVRPRGARLAPAGPRPSGQSMALATGSGRVWVAGVRDIARDDQGLHQGEVVLTAHDPRGARIGTPLALGRAPTWLPRVAVGVGAVWVANAPVGTITRVDPDQGRVVARIRVPEPAPRR